MAGAGVCIELHPVTVERLWEVIEQLGFDRGEVRRHLVENAPFDAPIEIKDAATDWVSG